MTSAAIAPIQGSRADAKALFDQGLGYRRAAQLLHHSENTVRDWLRAYKAGAFEVDPQRGAPCRRTSQQAESDARRIRALQRNCLSVRRIAEIIGVSERTVRNTVKRTRDLLPPSDGWQGPQVNSPPGKPAL